ncbi:RnfH family protein [Alkanindiges sp. WGS2144]|uniref:RnfH family protein n=1 Tax=Alkanindiges sp. WGS2144 TaxID=3366808 RepID=UPI0037515FCE
MDEAKKPTVLVAYADQGGQYLVSVDWQPTLTAQQALQASGLLSKLPPEQPLVVGVFGVKVDQPETYLLHANDRLEIYRPLTRDPKEVRRKRAEINPVGRFRRKL